MVNPQDLSASDLLVWGIVLHLIADWPLQNDWMARNKANLKHPAGYIHAEIHGILLAFIFGWVAIPLAVTHLLIDTRKPVVWWSKLIRQTQPENYFLPKSGRSFQDPLLVYDIGTEVRVWTDQVFHIVCIAIAALLVT
jgi:Protein of unknown function (DUF3307)